MIPFPVSTKAAGVFDEIRRAVPRLGLTFAREKPAAALDAVMTRLEQLDDEELLGAPIVDSASAACVRAGLWLRADRMDASHEISQSIETPDGSYWHGILHRREPDYSNAKYWFRRVGDHAIFAELASIAGVPGREGQGASLDATPGGRWDPFRFVDLCASGPQGSRRSELEEIQSREIDLLLAHCARRAVAPARARGGVAS
jgi:hypothetical protein